MTILERCFALEPSQAFLTLQRCWCACDEVAVRGPGPVVEVIDEAVGLGIAVNVRDDGEEMSFVGDGDSFEGAFEEGAGAVELLIERLCVGI